MASVQELLLAAEAKKSKSPIVQLLESGLTGYDQGRQDRSFNVDVATKLLQQQQLKSEIEQNAEITRLIKSKMMGQEESSIRNGLNSSTVTPKPIMSNDKMKVKLGISGGKSVVSIEEEPNSKMTQFKYVDPSGKERLGLISDTGQRTMTPNDPYTAGEKPTIDKSMQSAITKSKLELATLRPNVESVVSEIKRAKELNKNSYGGYAGLLQMKVRSGANIGTNDEKFKNTSELTNILKQQVVKMLRPTFGAQFTENEGNFLKQIYGAAEHLSPTEREIAMDTVMRMAEESVKAKESTYNEMIGQSTSESKLNPSNRFQELIDEGKTEEDAYKTLAQEGY